MKQKTRKNSHNGADRVLYLYFREVSKISLLSVEEERALGRRALSGDLNAAQKLVVSNLRFVIKIAKHYANNSDKLMDLINVGNIGLIEASRRFNPDMNVRFTSYAVWWIWQAILHELAETSLPFRIPARTQNILNRVSKISNIMSQSGNGEDRLELAEQVGVTPEELDTVLRIKSAGVSLDEPVNEEGSVARSDLLEQTAIPSPEQEAIARSLRISLERSIERLKPIEQAVIRLRFGLDDASPMTLKSIGDTFNLSRERIRQLESDALRKLHALQTASTRIQTSRWLTAD